MATFAELFGDEISDLKQHIKSEEEIKKYSTAEDMGEVKRSVFILKKGYQSQKVTVINSAHFLQIIENLYRLMREPGANEELLPIILNSMEIWDEKMQTECARSFEKQDVVRLMTSQNQTKLMEECLNYIINADSTHEELVAEWVKVFKKLVISLSMDYIKNNVIKKILDLPSLKQQYPRRKIGFELFCYIIDAKGEEGFKADPNLLKILINMCTDTNWRVRKQGAQFLYDFLQQLHTMQKKNKNKSEEEKHSSKSPQKPGTSQSASSQSAPDVVRVTKARFKSHLYDIMVELSADEEGLVQIEGIEIMTEYLLVVKRKLIEIDYIPNLEKMLKQAQDPVTADEIRIRMTKISGKVLDKLAQCMLATKYEAMFMEFFKVMIKDKNIDVKIQAAYNLPCFYFTFRSSSEENQEYFDNIYRELIVETQNQNIDILKTLSASIHEALSLISYDQGSLGNLSECVRILMNSPHRAVRDALATNIDQIIENYMKENDLKEIVETLIISQNQPTNGSNNLVMPNGKDFGQKTTKNFQINQQEEVSGRGGTGSGKNRVKGLMLRDEDNPMGTASENKNFIVRLQEYVDIDLVPEENHKEFLYSKLLDDILVLNKNIMNDKGNWRTQELFINNLGSQLQNFNAIEILDTFGSQMFELMRSNCDQVRNSAAYFVCNMINIQYRQQRRQELIDLVVTEYAKSNSFVLRKTYISLCIAAIKVFSFKTFKTYFLDDYMQMVHDPVAEVRMKFLQAAPFIRPLLEQDIDLMLKFNNNLNYLQTQDPSKNITELAQKINSQLIKNKGQPQGGGINEAQERQKQAYEKKLSEREVFEEEQRKKKSEEEEDSKFDYLTLLVNTTKKYGNMRRAGGGAITFKQYLNKKSPAQGLKQFSSPPVIGKANGIGASQPPQFSSVSTASTGPNSNTGSSILLAPNQQLQAQTPNTLTQTSHFKKRTSQMVTSTTVKNATAKNPPGLFPPIGSVIKDQNQAKEAIRTVRKSELILQSQINQNPMAEVGVNSATNSNYQANSFSSGNGKRNLVQKALSDGMTAQSQNVSTGPYPNEVHSILRKNQINVSQGSSLNGFSHSNSLGGPYSNNYLSTGQSGSYSNSVSSTLVNGSGSQISSLNKKRLSSEDLDRAIQSGNNSNTVSRTNLNSQQKH